MAAHIDPAAFLSGHPIDIIIAALSLLAFGLIGVERFKQLGSLIYVLIILLRLYKHIGPMAKHYFDTHPVGRRLRGKTKIDNKINYLIKTHSLPYDKDKQHDELVKHGAEG